MTSLKTPRKSMVSTHRNQLGSLSGVVTSISSGRMTISTISPAEYRHPVTSTNKFTRCNLQSYEHPLTKNSLISRQHRLPVYQYHWGP